MNFGFTEEQDLLRQEVRKFFDQKCPLDQVRRLMETEAGFCRDQWQQLGELGWLGLTIPEAYGGAGLGWVDLTVVLEEMGRTLYPSPFLATTLAAAALREGGSPEQQRRWLPEIAAGSRIATLAVLEASDLPEPAGVGLLGRREGRGFTLHGEKLQVLDAAAADLLVVAFRPEGGAPTLAVVEVGAPGVRAEAQASIDLTRRVGRVRFDAAAVPDDAILPGGEAALARTLDRAAAAVTAEMIGAAEGALALTVAYAKQRVQFGSPIGRFQGVKHPLAEMYVDVESFKSLLYYAAWTLDEGQADAPRAVSLAKAYASEAFARIGVDCVQLHGGIGYTWEYDAQLYLKRSKWARPAFGDSGYHYDRVVRLGGGA